MSSKCYFRSRAVEHIDNMKNSTAFCEVYVGIVFVLTVIRMPNNIFSVLFYTNATYFFFCVSTTLSLANTLLFHE